MQALVIYERFVKSSKKNNIWFSVLTAVLGYRQKNSTVAESWDSMAIDYKR